MNARILELIKNPENIQSEDLNLLETEIKSTPYVQNFRALYLYGTHRFKPENYQKELSKTAAYTTDKKILYHFINKNILEENAEDEGVVKNEDVFSPLNSDETTTLESENSETQKNVDEFDFEDEIKQEDSIENIDYQVVDSENNEIKSKESEEFAETENIKPEIITGTSENELPAETEEKVENSVDLSFHHVDAFLPNVEVPVENKVEQYKPKPTVNRHEEEMKRLIAEVEAKIKAKKEARTSEEKPTEEEAASNEISFAETQSFYFGKTDNEQVTEAAKEEPKEIKTEEVSSAEQPAQNTNWKPMSFSTNTPDALITKAEKPNVEPKPAAPKTKIKEEVQTTVNSEKSEEREAINVSFFAPTVSKIESEEKPEVAKTSENIESNVPKFINTWQNWLKIERPETQHTTEKIKEQAIEKFIENEPKISKLKDESNFVIKEKADDISHLMTETLAKVYAEQRLYSKAVKAYKILQQKHPEKSEYFAEKIAEINEMRGSK